MQIPAFARFPWLPWVLIVAVGVVILLITLATRARRRWKIALSISIWLMLSCSCAGLGVATFYTSLYSGPPANVPAPVPDSFSLSFLETVSGVGGLSQRLMTLNARTGAARWQYVTGSYGPLPGADEHAYYVVEGTMPTISALRRSDGQELWHVTLRSPTHPQQPLRIFEPPVVSDGILYVTAADEPSGSLIFALHADSGALAWTFPAQSTGANSDLRSRLVAAGQGMLFVELASGEVAALRSDDGTRVWSAPANSDETLAGFPVFADGKLYITYALPSSRDASSGLYVFDQHIVALDARDGKRVWSHLAHGYTNWSSGPLSVGAQSLYYQSAVTGDHGEQQYLNQISAQTGELQWQYEVINPSANIGAVEAGDLVYFASSTYLDALRVSDGHRVWRHSFQPNTGFGVPVVVDGVLYVKSYIVYPHVIVWHLFGPGEPEAAINALNASTGALYWRSAAEGVQSFAPPWLTPGTT